MKEFVYYGELFNIYKGLLNDANKKYYSLYYEENLTLQEIADLENVSKSYVGNIINKTSKRLDNFENVLGLYKKYSLLESALEEKSLENVKKVIKEILN